MAATVDDVVTKLTAETSAIEAIGMAVDEGVAKLAELRDLVAAGGQSPEKLQQAVDAIDAHMATLVANRDKLAAAVVAGTPAAPPA